MTLPHQAAEALGSSCPAASSEKSSKSPPQPLLKLGKRFALASLVLCGSILWLPVKAQAKGQNSTPSPEASEELALTALPHDDALAALLWSQHPEFAELRVELAEVEAELGRARLLPNPEIDFSWETIPLGKTNPPGLNRLREVPGYGVGLSQQFELGKRGPRSRAAQHEKEAALLNAQERLRQHLLNVFERIAEVAEVQTRTAIFERLVEDASQLALLERRKAQAGEGTGLDAARAQVEEEWFRAGLDDAIAALEEALAACAEAAAVRCLPFESEESARTFLIERAEGWRNQHNELDQRADLKALEAKVAASKEREREALAHRIPDPELRLAYLADTYDDADQRHSLSLELAIPIPLFDRGQVETREARAQATSLQEQLSRRLRQLHHERRAAKARADAGARRRDRLNSKTVPLSRKVAEAMEEAVRKGGVPLQEVILARRAQSELELEAAEAELDAFFASLSLYRLAGPQPQVSLEERGKR